MARIRKCKMTLGFYYHTRVVQNRDGEIGMPAFLGLFVDSLAEVVNELILFMHVQDGVDTAEYVIKSPNVTLVNIGSARAAYLRFYFPGYYLDRRNVKANLLKCDYVLVRSPSPLAARFCSYVEDRRLVFFIVGNYKEGLKFLDLPWYKLWAVKWLNYQMHIALEKAVKGRKVLVNSVSLLKEYRGVADSIALVNTTTLHRSDFFIRPDTCLSPEIKLLFVGRLDFAKGIRECIEVCGLLRRKDINASLTIVGWEDGGDRVTNILKELVSDLDLTEFVHFEGRKQSGFELLKYYRTHDIYLLPSHHEGFPRTIWEALANSIPVVSTTVGSIPDFIKDEHEALLVAPRSIEGLSQAIERVIYDGSLRKNLIANGFERVKEVTLGTQAKRLIEFVKGNE